MLRARVCLALVLALASGCASVEEEPEFGSAAESGPPKATVVGRRDKFFFVSAETVEHLAGDLGGVAPPVLDPGDAESLLAPASCLGGGGPISAFGPLGSLGPVGQNIWNPSTWISGMSWDQWSRDLTDLGGPLSTKGPLGPDGPLSPGAYFRVMPAISDFAKHLVAGGVWGVLGPVGPLGALGALGPLGPVGAHGFRRDLDGNFVDGDGKVQRVVTVPWTESTSREYELFEDYRESFAKTFADHDTSFMVEGVLLPSSETDTFKFTSRYDQFVTIAVVPVFSLDDFDLRVKFGKNSIVSASHDYIDWIQVFVKADTKMSVSVSLASSGHFLSKDYRLFVVGSTPWIDASDVTGDHQIPYAP